MATIPGAGHYDSVAIGDFAGEAEVDPVAFLIAGSAGVYVVDADTGRTRMAHRIGHAQSHVRCGALRSDLAGTQIAAFCRWGNFGITTLFSGNGGRLWTIQPDNIPGVLPIQWGNRMRRDVITGIAKMGSDPRELLCMTIEDRMHVFGPG